MRVGLFAHRLAQRHPTVIARYTSELVSALARVLPERDALLACSTREDGPPSWVPRPVQARVVVARVAQNLGNRM